MPVPNMRPTTAALAVHRHRAAQRVAPEWPLALPRQTVDFEYTLRLCFAHDWPPRQKERWTKEEEMEPSGRPLEHTFMHLPRIGPRTEQRLWEDGILTWTDLEEARRQPADLFAPPRDDCLVAIEASREALTNKNADYFASRLPSREHYRIAATFPADTVFLDIETTGLSLYYDDITMIGLSRGTQYVCWFPDAPTGLWHDLLSDAKCLVTFNGTVFDLKFLERIESCKHFPRAHVDLRYFARRAQLKGGQKKIEHQLGFTRPEQIGNATGADAVRLWYEYRNGDLRAGRDLVQYNHSDLEGMKTILDEAIRRVAESRPLKPAVPFAAARAPICFKKRGGRGNVVDVPHFQGRVGPRATYEDLFDAARESITIIGIDLTGAERRPSGWCRLTGRHAETRMVKTDAEMLEAIASIRPHLVSIDSPLSLPHGRIRVDDDDPGRKEYGIMRECERTLKRRGINVYPCLIRSMQRLTDRGMNLAAQIRTMGIPVIESYPGAAQDIMDIPRKRASLAQLKEGLRLFGVEGRSLLADANPTHDELDAITSAVVGLFFWSGRFDALGNEDEDYLIIPEISNSRESRWRDCLVVGVSGPISSGKTTIARWLEEQRNFVYGRYSQVVADEARRQGKAATRQVLQDVGQSIHVGLGQRWLNRKLLHRLQGRGHMLVVDGLRWPEDRAFWVERYGPAFRHFHLDAATVTRCQRYAKQHGPQADFDAASSHDVESGVLALRCFADHILRNEGEQEQTLRVCDTIVPTRLWRDRQCP